MNYVEIPRVHRVRKPNKVQSGVQMRKRKRV